MPREKEHCPRRRGRWEAPRGRQGGQIVESRERERECAVCPIQRTRIGSGLRRTSLNRKAYSARGTYRSSRIHRVDVIYRVLAAAAGFVVSARVGPHVRCNRPNYHTRWDCRDCLDRDVAGPLSFLVEWRKSSDTDRRANAMNCPATIHPAVPRAYSNVGIDSSRTRTAGKVYLYVNCE